MPTQPPYAQSARKPAGPNLAQRRYDRRRADTPALAWAAAFRGSFPWKQLRAAFLALHPICGACLNALARQVHHVVPLEKDPSRALDWDNLAPVCTRCHADCNRDERADRETAPRFANFKRRSISGDRLMGSRGPLQRTSRPCHIASAFAAPPA
ncbi:MAG: HNH endonuclease [Opitutaceae bacterium]|nr:HNH endonuclease [Opitutaceae bacterium]